MATIKRTGPDRWRVWFYLGTDANGHERKRTKVVHGTRRDAERVAAELLLEHGDAGSLDHGRITVAQAARRWLDDTQRASYNTMRNRRYIIDHYLDSQLGQIPIGDVTVGDLERFYLDAGVSTSTLVNIRIVLRGTFATAQRWGWIKANPYPSAATPKPDEPRDVTPPTPEQVRGLICAARVSETPYMGDLIELAAATGARRGELLGLTWRHVDLEAAELLIEQSVAEADGGAVVKGTKTGGRRRIALAAGSVTILGRLRADAVTRSESLDVELGAGGFVFSPDELGRRPYYPSTVTHRFSQLRGQVPGAGGVRFHDLRHFTASRMLAAGVDVRTVAGRLGHRDASVTLNTYGHFIPAADRAAADALGELLDGR